MWLTIGECLRLVDLVDISANVENDPYVIQWFTGLSDRTRVTTLSSLNSGIPT